MSHAIRTICMATSRASHKSIGPRVFCARCGGVRTGILVCSMARTTRCPRCCRCSLCAISLARDSSVNRRRRHWRRYVGTMRCCSTAAEAGLAADGRRFCRLRLANSFASLVIVALAPVLGAIADQGGAKKKFLLFFTAMGVVMTGALYLVEQGAWPWAVLLYILASIGFAGGNVFYDALIVVVARREKLDFVSALGFSLGD